jgi:hypothetical protein
VIYSNEPSVGAFFACFVKQKIKKRQRRQSGDNSCQMAVTYLVGSWYTRFSLEPVWFGEEECLFDVVPNSEDCLLRQCEARPDFEPTFHFVSKECPL